MADSNTTGDWQTSKTWQNWAGTIEFQPDSIFQPVTLDDLNSHLKQAQTNGKKVRVVGSGHSWSLGAVPGDAPYVPNGQVDAYLIDVSGMNPTNCAQDAYLKAFYFTDSANTPYVAVPPGTAQGWLSDNAANNVANTAGGYDPTHQYSNEHEDLALGSMGPAPDITLGGFIANGCHGTGWGQPTVADLVCAIEIMTIDEGGNVVTKAYALNQELANILSQNQLTKAAPQVAPDAMKALRVSLGALGVITKLVFQLEPLFRVRHLDEYVDISEIFPASGDSTNLATLVTSCDYIEIFWFPYNKQAWIKRFKRTDAPLQHQDKVVGFTWITSALARLTDGKLGDWFQAFPSATPTTLKLFFSSMKKLMNRHLHNLDFDLDFKADKDPIVNVNDAYLYQIQYFNDLLDLSYTVPIPQTTPGTYDFGKVLDAWNDAYNGIMNTQATGPWPVSLVVHLRFIKNSDSLLSPANQAADTTHTCYIEYLGFSQQVDVFTPYTQKVGAAWAAYGGLPHWAKIFQIVPDGYSGAHTKLQESGHLQPFMALRQELDPTGIFMNDFLNQLLNGAPSSAAETMPRALEASASAARYPARQFQLTNSQTLEKLGNGDNGEPTGSQRGCYLSHDAEEKIAMLVDENGAGHLMQYDYNAAENRIAYRLLSASQFLSPGEIFRRVDEVLKSQG
jgi:L-gulono-1,4-lactone dehydrogenase